jgi:regulator of sigma E protease
MDTLIQVAQLILALTILVFIHELGHYLTARMFGIRVDKFYIFFDAWGKKLWSFKRGGTEYGIGWLPLGGYVKIAGMIDESMDTDQMKSEPQPWEFRSKPNWQKFIVMIGGIVMNVILGIILFIVYLNTYEKHYTDIRSVNANGGIYATEYGKSQEVGLQTGDKLLAVNGKEYTRLFDYTSQRVYFGAELTIERDGKQLVRDIPNDAFKHLMLGEKLFDIRSTVSIDSFSSKVPNAKNAGLQEKDIIRQINGEEVISFTQLTELLKHNKGDTAMIAVERNMLVAEIPVLVDSNGQIGFIPGIKIFPYDSLQYSLGKSVAFGTRDAYEIFYFQAIGVWKIITGQIPAKDSIQSPIGITRYFPKEWDWAAFWRMTALLSMVLAFMNLLPIPALDGGHILFIGIESITRRKLSDKFLERAQVVGMVLLLSLMVFAVFNDIF